MFCIRLFNNVISARFTLHRPSANILNRIRFVSTAKKIDMIIIYPGECAYFVEQFDYNDG